MRRTLATARAHLYEVASVSTAVPIVQAVGMLLQVHWVFIVDGFLMFCHPSRYIDINAIPKRHVLRVLDMLWLAAGFNRFYGLCA